MTSQVERTPAGRCGAQTRPVWVLAIALLTGCSGGYSSADLAGKYVLSVDGGVDTIELSANGTCVHSYETKNAEMDHQGGTWTLEEPQAGSTVVLNDFPPLLAESFRGGGGPSIYLLLVERSFASIYLITDIDLDVGYKQRS